MEPRQSILLTAKQQLLWKKKAEADEVRRTKQFLKYQQEHTRARLHEQQMNDVKRLQDLEANYLNRLDELNTNMDTIEKNKEARRKAFLTKLESNHRGRILKKQSDIEELRSTQNVDIYEALDGVQEQAKELEETSRNSSDNSGLLSDSSTDNLTMITQSQDKHNKHLPPPTMLVPGRNGEVVSVHLVGSPMPVHDPIVARRARAKSDMGEYKNNSRPRSRSTGKIPSSRRISVCNKPASQARYDRKIKYRAASETMDKEALTSSNDKAKRLTAPGQKRRPVANSPKPPRHLGHSKKANQAPSALASLSSIDNTPSVVHRSYESQPFDKRQMKPEYHQFRDIRSSSYAKSPEFEGRSEKMKKMLNYYENRVQKDFAPKANQSLRDDLD